MGKARVMAFLKSRAVAPGDIPGSLRGAGRDQRRHRLEGSPDPPDQEKILEAPDLQKHEHGHRFRYCPIRGISISARDRKTSDAPNPICREELPGCGEGGLDGYQEEAMMITHKRLADQQGEIRTDGIRNGVPGLPDPRIRPPRPLGRTGPPWRPGYCVAGQERSHFHHGQNPNGL
jgi:hypothetical protein